MNLKKLKLGPNKEVQFWIAMTMREDFLEVNRCASQRHVFVTSLVENEKLCVTERKGNQETFLIILIIVS